MLASERGLLRLSHVSSSRGGLPVIDDVSFEAGSEIVAVLGLNGSGKTTLLRTICGLTRPTSGVVEFDGKQISGLRAHQTARLGIGYMQQDNQLFLDLSVSENLRLGAWLIPARDYPERLRYVLNLLPMLKHRMGAKASAMSGGQRQQLALAKTLIRKPRLLLLDEPTGGLAPIVVSEFYKLLAEIRGEGIPIILAEQNIPQALELANKVIVLVLGRLTGVFPAERLRSDPQMLRDLLLGSSWERRSVVG